MRELMAQLMENGHGRMGWEETQLRDNVTRLHLGLPFLFLLHGHRPLVLKINEQHPASSAHRASLLRAAKAALHIGWAGCWGLYILTRLSLYTTLSRMQAFTYNFYRWDIWGSERLKIIPASHTEIKLSSVSLQSFYFFHCPEEEGTSWPQVSALLLPVKSYISWGLNIARQRFLHI